MEGLGELRIEGRAALERDPLAPRLDGQVELVAELERDEQALEQVVAVRAPAHEREPEVQLGRCEQPDGSAHRLSSTNRMRRS
jgi:hypothetical protein